MVNAFTANMCRGLDIRFSSFSQQEIDPMRNEIREIKSDVRSLKAEVATLKQEISDLLLKLDKYDEQIGCLDRECRFSII